MNKNDFAKVIEILESNENTKIEYRDGAFQDFVFWSNKKDTDLKLKIYRPNTLVIQSVNFSNKHIGTMTQIFKELKEICLKNKINAIMIQSVLTPEMKAFCDNAGLISLNENQNDNDFDGYYGDFIVNL